MLVAVFYIADRMACAWVASSMHCSLGTSLPTKLGQRYLNRLDTQDVIGQQHTSYSSAPTRYSGIMYRKTHIVHPCQSNPRTPSNAIAQIHAFFTQSCFAPPLPFPILPRSPSFSLRWMKPPRPYDLLFLLLPYRITSVKEPTTIPRLRNLWVLMKWLRERKKP